MRASPPPRRSWSTAALFSSFGSVDNPNAGFWVSLILSAAIVKPIVYGAATGIAVAALLRHRRRATTASSRRTSAGSARRCWPSSCSRAACSSPRASEGTTGAVIGLVWGALIAAVAARPAALPAALRGARGGAGGVEQQGSSHEGLRARARRSAPRARCRCSRARTSASSAAPRPAPATRSTRDPQPHPTTPPARAPTLAPTPEGVAPRDNKKTALVVGAVVATILIAGVAARRPRPRPPTPTRSPTDGGITLEPDVGSGPTTEPAPEPGPRRARRPTSRSSRRTRVRRRRAGASFTSTVRTATYVDALSAPSVRNGGIGDTGEEADEDDGGGIGTTTSTGDVVDLGSGIGFAVPENWEVELETENGFAQLVGKRRLLLRSTASPAPTDIETLITDHLAGDRQRRSPGAGVHRHRSRCRCRRPRSSRRRRSSTAACSPTSRAARSRSRASAYYFITQDGTGVIADSGLPSRAAQRGLAAAARPTTRC